MPPNQASHPLPQYKVSWGAPVRRPLGDQGGRGPPAPAGLLLSSIRAQRNSIELPACVGICCEREARSWRCRDLVYMGLSISWRGLPRHWCRSPELGWKEKEKKRVRWLAASVFLFISTLVDCCCRLTALLGEDL
ncbi:hypothetical protein PVAP13_7NG384921 [Panicum virgatum]|uniref:Uncharacterized protein n=1 Tax=Panicum virgatum TaxID=38727 RepID=A0A8T0Q7J3_PANVG|nr:hypothetical protein PVAP13_7NG384921 [Panicum virgatum]